MKYLIIRTDRLGDCILASPVWQALKESWPEAEVSFLTRQSFQPLFESDPLLERVMALPKGDRRALDKLSRLLSEMSFDALIVLYVDRAVARLVRKTAAALKVGPLSRPHSWFLFNRPMRQRRSQSLMHEADYNGDLLQALGVPYRPQPPRVYLNENQSAREGDLFERLFGGPPQQRYVVVHPGMGGSAENWPAARYEELVHHVLEERAETIVLTGTAADEGYLGDLPMLKHPRFINTVGTLDLVELALLLRRAAVFVGPSTGPMHLATALDRPVVALFSPVKVQQPRRWGPYHARATVLTPPVECVEKFRCRPGRCPDYDCMKRIALEDVLSALQRWLVQ